MKKTKKVLKTILFLILIVLITYYSDEINELINEEISKDNIGTIVNNKVNNLEVQFLDVGEAESILIRYQDKNILIDAGNNADGKKLVDYFNSLNITKFDYLIGTHAHEDHVGGMDDIINNYKINHFYMPSKLTTTKTFEDILDSLDKNNISFETPNKGKIIKLLDTKLKILSIDNDAEELNDTSIVIKMTYKNVSFLFTGDISSKVENALLSEDISSTVLKIAHHGSSYSSTYNFLEKTNPKYAVIEVGKNNSYNHPAKSVINRLNKLNIKTYRTDKNNTIVFKTDGNNIEINEIKTNTDGG